jgi:hypothetical protein
LDAQCAPSGKAAGHVSPALPPPWPRSGHSRAITQRLFLVLRGVAPLIANRLRYLCFHVGSCGF